MPVATSHIVHLCGTQPPKCAYRLASAVAAGVAYLHEQGWVHRDIKPCNILVVGGVPKVCDVDGMVRQGTVSESTQHTWLYAAPEVAKNLYSALVEEQPRDVWALGIVCHELLLGRPPAPFFPTMQDCVMNQQRGRQLWAAFESKHPDQKLADRAELCYYGLVASVVLRPSPAADEVGVAVKRLLDRCFRRLPKDRCPASRIRDDFAALSREL
eukprot:TRINITY_DN28624_c0_g1_i1.p2 TRINITY_DN28624_c0_g1~~TRINITY_DN28624_c0_g1_i1.p2  ORF type:complete len:213 (+),score=59.88 TRINITY_DN28624_c0_g1_i1:1526-2164(+)